MKKYIILGHMHPAIKSDDRFEKIWIISKIGRKIGSRYKKFNVGIKLVMAPAFNDLIIG